MEEVNSPDKIELTASDIQSMKVADLKKELKARGIPVTGNKTELADRLSAAFTLPKSGDNSESCDDVNEDEVLADDVLLHDDVKVQEEISEEELFGSPNNKEEKESSENNVSVPKVKENSGVEVKQKIQLTRTLKTYSAPARAETTHKDITAPEKDVKKEPVVATPKPLSQAERLSLRAKRFNLEESEVPKTKTGRVGITSSNSKITSNVTATVGQLKKRAERFGQNVSTVMKQVEEKERLLKRKSRFGQIVVASGGDHETVKKRRQERFGLRQ